MIPVLTPAEMASADARTTAAGTPEGALIERAGRAVAWRVRAVLGGTYGRRIAVIAGRGNNGNDGRVAGAALRAWGAHVVVLNMADGIDGRARRAIARAHLVVDAMFGTGLRDTLEGNAAEFVGLIASARVAGALVIAVDIPSGVDGLTGAVRGPAVHADHTVTFAAPKPGLWFHPGRAHSGAVTMADIGIDLGSEAWRTVIVEPHDVAHWIPRREVTAHKWRSGVLVVGGSDGMTGAPMLVAHAALRLGAGIVWAALPGRSAELASGSEVITVALPDDGAGVLAEHGVATLQAALACGRFGALVLGPGLGRAPETAAAVRSLVATTTIPLVLDADGLTAMTGELDNLRHRTAATVLTPHDGEFARLTGAPPGEDRIAAARALAVVTNAVVLLKGPTTVVAAPDGRVALNPTGGPALATAGSGDVLSGMIGAFCAQGIDGFEAAAAGAFVHGRAADRAGHTGLVASDLPVAAAGVLNEIMNRNGQEA